MAIQIKNSERLLIQWTGGFGKRDYITMLDIINWGEPHGSNSIKFPTVNGDVIKDLNSFNDGYTKVVKVEDINVEKSLFWWFKNHVGEYNKPLVYDENLEAGERYFGNCWRAGLLLASTETEIKYNFIFE